MPVIDLLRVTVSGLAVFLVGANIAFLVHLGPRMVRWFTLKVSAVILLLTYVASSVVWATSATWILALGLAAVTLDVVAVYRMWVANDRPEPLRKETA